MHHQVDHTARAAHRELDSIRSTESEGQTRPAVIHHETDVEQLGLVTGPQAEGSHMNRWPRHLVTPHLCTSVSSSAHLRLPGELLLSS